MLRAQFRQRFSLPWRSEDHGNQQPEPWLTQIFRFYLFQRSDYRSFFLSVIWFRITRGYISPFLILDIHCYVGLTAIIDFFEDPTPRELLLTQIQQTEWIDYPPFFFRPPVSFIFEWFRHISHNRTSRCLMGVCIRMPCVQFQSWLQVCIQNSEWHVSQRIVHADMSTRRTVQ